MKVGWTMFFRYEGRQRRGVAALAGAVPWLLLAHMRGGGRSWPGGRHDDDGPLGREWAVPGGHALRVRMTFAATVNAIIYIIFEC